MFELLRHLREQGRLTAYLRLLLGRHRQLVAYLLVIAAASYAVFSVNDRAIDRERRAQLTACERVQILRDQTNGLALIAYDAWENAAAREEALIKEDPTEADAHRKSSESLAKLAQTMVVTGPTNCIAAVDHPDTYRAPAPQFVFEDGPQVKVVRKRSAAIVTKALNGEPLTVPEKGKR